MKTILKKSAVLLSLSALSFSAMASQLATYELSFTNLTKGQPLTPAAIVIHDGSFKLFKVGEKAGLGLSQLAEDGMTATLTDEVLAQSDKNEVLSLGGLTLPGQTTTIQFEASPKSKLSLASMLAKTNDGFASSVSPFSLYLRKGQKTGNLLYVFDAGSEANNEMQAYIPAFGNAGVRTDANEGFVTFHPGLQGIGDVDYQNEAFAPQAARVIIKRIK